MVARGLQYSDRMKTLLLVVMAAALSVLASASTSAQGPTGSLQHTFFDPSCSVGSYTDELREAIVATRAAAGMAAMTFIDSPADLPESETIVERRNVIRGSSELVTSAWPRIASRAFFSQNEPAGIREVDAGWVWLDIQASGNSAHFVVEVVVYVDRGRLFDVVDGESVAVSLPDGPKLDFSLHTTDSRPSAA